MRKRETHTPQVAV